MNLKEFQERFPERTLIGRNITPTIYQRYYDNGKEVGVWRYNRATSLPEGGRILSEDAAASIRLHFRGVGR